MNFLIRCLTATFFISLIGWALFWASSTAFSAGVCVFSALGLFEFLTALKQKGVQVYRFFGVSMGFMIPWVVHFQYGLTQSGEVLFVVLACLCLFVIQFSREENPRALEGIALTFFGLMYIGWFLSHIIKIKYLPYGAWRIVYLLVVTKIGDVSAYIVGTRWGRHSLIPHISPKKSVEGTLAGLVVSALVSVCFYGNLPFDFTALHLLVLGGVIGLVGQCGDLSESLIKRYCAVKDSGNWIPGFGGLLDTMDSALFTIPLFYFYIKTLPIA